MIKYGTFKYFDSFIRTSSCRVLHKDVLNARAFGSTKYAKTRGYRRSWDKKRVISSMNPRAKRKPVVIRVSLGARSPHYSWFIQTRAARFYYFLVTSQGKTRVRYSSFLFVPRYYYYDHCFHPLHLRDFVSLFFTLSSLLSSLLFSLYVCLPSSASFTVASVCGTLLKNYTSKPLWPFSPVSFHRLRYVAAQLPQRAWFFRRLFGSGFMTPTSSRASAVLVKISGRLRGWLFGMVCLLQRSR